MKLAAKTTKKTWVIVLSTILALGALVGVVIGPLYATGVLGDKDDYTVMEFVEDLTISTLPTDNINEYTTKIYTDYDDEEMYSYNTVTIDLTDASVITYTDSSDVLTIDEGITTPITMTTLVSDPISMNGMSTTGITYTTVDTVEGIPYTLTDFTMTFTDITYNGKTVDDYAEVRAYAAPEGDDLEYEYRFEVIG